METFTASNGLKIQTKPDGPNETRILDQDNSNTLEHFDFLYSSEMTALREFFLHEHDTELGRWRMTGGHLSHWVVHPLGEDRCLVVDEQNGFSREYERGETVGRGTVISNAYFAARPVPKPLPSEPHTAWVDKYGTDIWWVDGAGVLRCCASTSSDPAKYAPFTRLVPEAPSE